MRFSLYLTACMTALLLLLPVVSGAQTDARIRLRPVCVDPTQFCEDFLQYDADTYTTRGLKEGDVLDMEIVIDNPSAQPIQSVQAWLAYNADILEGDVVQMSDEFPLIAPGEQEFAPERNVVKLGASNVTGGVQASEIVFARVSFRVTRVPEEDATTESIAFFEFALLGSEGKTKVLVVEGGKTVNVLKTRPTSLRLYFGEEDPPPTIVEQPSSPGIPPLPQLPDPTDPSDDVPPNPTPPRDPTSPTDPLPLVPSVPPVDQSFRSLQPQGLRLTTEGDAIYVIWSHLTDPRVAGYNVYYGTVSGRYIQRRTIPADDNSVAIRGLPAGQRYYIALTAYSADQQETDYSFEESVVVGDATSATAPFTRSPDAPAPPPPDTNVLGRPQPGDGASAVPGDTGVSEVLLACIALFAGVIGFMHWRRYVQVQRVRHLLSCASQS